MTNKTITLARVRAADSLYLTMWPNDTLHECETGNPKWNACLNAIDAGYTKEVSAALADPVPPAGYPTAEIAQEAALGVYDIDFPGPDEEVEPVPPAGGEVEACCEVSDEKYNRVRFYRQTGDATKPYHAPGEKLYDQACVTRLQAEVEQWKLAHRLAMQDNIKLQSELTKARELLIPAECPHMIVFDDADRETLMFAGEGARTAALKTWEQISRSWNAHLFVRVERNSRDDRYPSANQSAPADKGQGEPVGYTNQASLDALKANGFCQILVGPVSLDDPIALYTEQPAPIEVVMPFDFEHPLSKERRTVTLTKRDVFDGMEDYFYDKLSEQICQCESVGETNVVDCNCDEYVHDFEIVQACLDEVGRLNSEQKP